MIDGTTEIAATQNRAQAISTVVAAFINDPVTRWVYPDVADYLRVFPLFADAFGGRAFDNGSAFADTGLHAVSLWLSPGLEPDGETMGAVMEPLSAKMSPRQLDDLQGFSAKQAECHPHYEHWYLPLIGVDPAYQGRGLGSALLSHALAAVDAAGLPAYLEATSLSNRRLYERHGFVAINEIQYGTSPTMVGMRRDPRPKA